MRRAPTEDDESMDALLDTMMNVVGILIIVLVVTQLGVGDAVKRIGETLAVDPATLKKTEQELASIEKQRDQLKASAQDLQQVDQQEIAKRLKDVLRKNALRQKELDKLLAEQEKVAGDKKRMEETEEQIQEKEELLDKLRKQILAAQDEEAQLKANLEETPPRKELPSVEVTLPNPRPAPKGAKQILFICSANKLYPLDINQFRADGQALGMRVIKAEKLELHLPVDNKQKIFYLKDPEHFIREFNRRSLALEKRSPKNRYFHVELVAAGSNPRLVFHPLESGGVTERTINRAQSSFRKRLKSVDPSSYYIRFNVCLDSFDVYVTARRIISRLDLLAGWEPLPVDWKFTTNLGGTIRFGPRPKPKPKPVNPPKPKPSKPVNVID
ncbi:MAG: hypothetical protein GXP26_04515 [Planctomycetes bacterium]|nr:hypothetical protein [Planctomycetota bacterium]